MDSVQKRDYWEVLLNVALKCIMQIPHFVSKLLFQSYKESVLLLFNSLYTYDPKKSNNYGTIIRKIFFDILNNHSERVSLIFFIILYNNTLLG